MTARRPRNLEYSALLIRHQHRPYPYFLTMLGPRWQCEDLLDPLKFHDPIIVPAHSYELTLVLLNG